MEKIRWSHEAEQWLREIYEYIAQDNPSAAEKVVSGIYDKAQLLSDSAQAFCRIFAALADETGTGSSLRVSRHARWLTNSARCSDGGRN